MIIEGDVSISDILESEDTTIEELRGLLAWVESTSDVQLAAYRSDIYRLLIGKANSAAKLLLRTAQQEGKAKTNKGATVYASECFRDNGVPPVLLGLQVEYFPFWLVLAGNPPIGIDSASDLMDYV